MLLIVGFAIVIGSVLGGFMMEGGKPLALVQPAELVVIGGAALGALVVMSPKKTLIDMLKAIVQGVKGTPYNRAGYEQLFKVWYLLLRLARSEGLMALESHVSNPHESSIFEQFPRIAGNHHVMSFICDAVSPIVEGTVNADRLPALLDNEIRSIEEEHHAPLGVLSKTADALPGFGIVAAVLGIVLTMAAIDGPVEEIGEKVGAALVGTFLGILLTYGFIAPLVVRLELLGTAELGFFRTIAKIAQGLAEGGPPKVVLEAARRAVLSEDRFNREELDQLFAQAEGKSGD
jgi:chemotaxis protein MotA